MVEGAQNIALAIRFGRNPVEIFYCPELQENWFALVEEGRQHGARVVRISEPALRRMSYRDDPDGLLAVVQSWPSLLSELRPSASPLILVAETIEKPGNLGAMMRTACAANADGLIVCDPQTDVFGPGVVRASLGTLFAMPLAVCRSGEALNWLRDRRIRIVAATPNDGAALWECNLADPVAIAVGNEHRGLSDLWMENADSLVTIPMSGPVNSLNATTAAGIVMFEALRQRIAGEMAL